MFRQVENSNLDDLFVRAAEGVTLQSRQLIAEFDS